uniref:Uncharacterized protein n=1 Tax=Tanacetum cinerariifolium TaxID=118510 RepID=A0A699H5U0_TANCI|nr:hypothetical protein [Tanacetum cinerariifolium]
MSATANTTLIVTTVTKPVTNPRGADSTPRVNIHDFCEEYYEDILPISMENVRRDKQKEVHARLDFREGSRERITREGSHYSSARTLSVRQERLKVRDRLRYNDRHMFDRLGHRRQSAFDRLSETYSPSTTESKPGRTSFKDRSRGINHRYRYHDRDRSRHMKRGRDSESSLSSVSKSDFSDGRHWKSKSKRHKPTDEDDLTMPWMCEDATAHVKRWAMPTWCHMFNSTLIGAARIWFDELPPKSIDSYKDLKAVFLAHFMQQKKYVKDTVEIQNIKQKDGDTIEDFLERLKVETGCMKPLNTMKKMMITTTAFIRGKATAVSKNKGKLSHLIKEIKHGRDQSKVGKKETPAKDKPTVIYMIQSRQRMTRQKVTQSFERGREITFPSLATSSGAEGPLVVETKIGGHMIHRMYVDGGSSTEVLYEHCFNRLQPEVKNQMVPATTSLTGFSGETIWPLRQLRLLVIIEDADRSTIAWMNFMIVSTILIPVECATVITSSKEIPKEASVRHENFKVDLHPNFPDQEVAIGETLSAKGRTELCSLLKENLDIFAWQPLDMTGVLRFVAEHRLYIREGYSPVQQKKGSGPERAKAIQAENASTMYQRLVDKAFDSQIGRNIEVYVDDLVIKSHIEAEMLRDIDETFWIKPCPDKTEAVLQLPSPRTIKEVQSLNGKLASLNRFLSKSAEKSLPLFKTLKKCIKKSDFYWTSEAEQAFKQLKAISAVLMTGRGMVQRPVYFVSRVLQGPELNYTPMEKLVLSLFFAAKRLRSPPDASVVETQQDLWTLFTDGSSCVDGSGAGLILTSPEGTEFTYALRFQFPASNNEAEYEALIAGLQIAAQIGVQNVHVSVDSKLVADQVLGAYVAKEENMIKYLEKVKSLVLVKILKEKSIQEKEVTTVVEEDGPTWMTPIIEYLKERTLPSDRKEAKSSVSRPLQADYVIREIHEGSCSMHARPCKAPAVQLTRRKSKPELGEGINVRLGEENKNWVKELPHVLWAHRTLIKSTHGNTPFSLTYRTEAVIPAEIGMPTYRTAAVDVVHNDEELRINLDLLEERRDRAAIHEAKAKLKMTKYYNARVRSVTFRPGDFVYRSNDDSHAMDGGKLGPKWEGRYEVTKALGDGAYKLRSMDGTVLPRTWNIVNLKKCYP